MSRHHTLKEKKEITQLHVITSS